MNISSSFCVNVGGADTSLHGVQSRNFKTLEYLAYSPTLAPRDYRLFSALKRNLGGHRFKEELDMETVLTPWLIT
jgi:hypothetical protein